MRASLAAPRYWPTWLGVCGAWLIAHAPRVVQIGLGHAAGAALFRIAHVRRHIADTNLRLCFPDLSEQARTDLVRAVFRSVGHSAIETAIAWFRAPAHYAGRLDVTGLPHLLNAQNLGRGVLLIGAHFATLDFAGALLSLVADIDVIYRYNKNPVIEWVMRRGRMRLFGGVIERKDTRAVVKRLRKGRTIWYAADQDYGRKVSVFAPFFGVPAATITAGARLARLNGSPALFFSHFRDVTTGRWSIHFSPIIQGYPSGDAVADATRINRLIEAEILKHPDQYLWLHRRFKTRPAGEARPY